MPFFYKNLDDCLFKAGNIMQEKGISVNGITGANLIEYANIVRTIQDEANKMLQDYMIFTKKSKVRTGEYHHILMQALQLIRVIAKKDPQLSALVQTITPPSKKRKKQTTVDTPTTSSSDFMSENGSGI